MERNITWKNRKISYKGNNLIIHIPQKAEHLLKLRKGMNCNITLLGDQDKIVLTFPAREKTNK